MSFVMLRARPSTAHSSRRCRTAQLRPTRRPGGAGKVEWRGHFRLDGLAPGEYGVTATLAAASLRTAATSSSRSANRLTATSRRRHGVTLSGHVRDDRGDPIAGAEVRAARFSDVNGDLFYARTDDTGAFAVTLPSGSYGVATQAPGRASDPESAPLTGNRTVELVARRVAPPGPAPREVIDWMRAHAVPIATAEAGHGFADLAPLKQIIGDARIVSVGEATHGTREFFQLKHRLFEYLATELGFTIFAIEANWPESLAIDEYVQTGKGDPQKALDGIYFWTWNTEEVLDLIRWMRRYNEDARRTRASCISTASTCKRRRWRWSGSSPTSSKSNRRSPRASARRWRPGRTGTSIGRSTSASAPTSGRRTLSRWKGSRDASTRRSGRWIAKHGGDAWTIARQHLRIVQQCDELTTRARRWRLCWRRARSRYGRERSLATPSASRPARA